MMQWKKTKDVMPRDGQEVLLLIFIHYGGITKAIGYHCCHQGWSYVYGSDKEKFHIANRILFWCEFPDNPEYEEYKDEIVKFI